MAKKALPCPTVVRQLVDYNPLTGQFTFKHRSQWLFNSDRQKAWNSRWAGKPAFTAKVAGYCHGHLLWAQVRAARVAFAYMEGKWPDGFVDHINGDRSDNRWANLRVVTPQENAQNNKRPSNNTSGHIGVTWDAGAGKWRAQISSGSRYIGVFSSIEDAIAARAAAEARLGYHANHGR